METLRMTISGTILAKCKLCDCVFLWTFNNMPFPDSEVIGTCERCINEESHQCIDETYIIDETDVHYKVAGRKEFKKRKKDGNRNNSTQRN